MKLGRNSVVWFGVAAASFAVATILTIVITSIEGGLPARIRDSQVDEQIQAIAVFSTDASVPTARQVSVDYSEYNRGRSGTIVFDFPANFSAKVVINGLEGERACSSARTADEVMLNDIQGGGIHVTDKETGEELHGSQLHVITVDPSVEPYHLQCHVVAVTRSHTFTRKRMRWYYVSDMRLMSSVEAELTGLSPLPALIVAFGSIPAAEDFTFNSGFEMSDMFAFESKRVMLPDTFLDVIWSDIFREQSRDIILIVIGTLIGIGVTVLIEGIRPLIEGSSQRGDTHGSPSA